MIDGGDCLTGADDPCPQAGWVPTCPGTTCPDNAQPTECVESCFKVPDTGTAWTDYPGQGRLGDGESDRHFTLKASKKSLLISTSRCRRDMRHVSQLRRAQMGPR